MKAIKWMGVAALAAVAGVAQAAEEGDWMVRVRALHMNVDNDNSGGLGLPIAIWATTLFLTWYAFRMRSEGVLR